jgi:CheY-like chemotaxis protein
MAGAPIQARPREWRRGMTSVAVMNTSKPRGHREIAAAMTAAKRRHPRRGRTPDELLARAANERSKTPRLDLHGVTVLIVEDHADSRDMLRQIVASFGATVVSSEDGREALRVVGWVAPDLILCDLRMPSLDGFGLLETLRHHPSLSRTPVIAVTALGSDEDVQRTWQAGFNGHLVKPVDYGMVAAALERIFWAQGGGPAR